MRTNPGYNVYNYRGGSKRKRIEKESNANKAKTTSSNNEIHKTSRIEWGFVNGDFVNFEIQWETTKKSHYISAHSPSFVDRIPLAWTGLDCPDLAWLDAVACKSKNISSFWLFSFFFAIFSLFYFRLRLFLSFAVHFHRRLFSLTDRISFTWSPRCAFISILIKCVGAMRQQMLF